MPSASGRLRTSSPSTSEEQVHQNQVWQCPADSIRRPRSRIDSPEAHQRFATLGGIIRTTMESRGIDLSAYNTIQSADDVELHRRALGVEKVVLWAHSHGTHLALALIRRHGEHVARALLGGVNGLDDRWRDPAGGDAWLARVDAAMKAGAPGGISVDFVEHVKRVFALLDKDPIHVTTADGEVLIGKSEIQRRRFATPSTGGRRGRIRQGAGRCGPPLVPEITDAFLRGEPARDERIAWPVSFRWPE
jgi:pimeloyl-ACP methyl ester carboxylesterase